MRTHRWSLLPSLEAEFILGIRLAARHPVARSALAWTVGLAAIVRVLGGAAAPDRAPSTIVALAGLLAAAAAPPLFVRGGPLEALRWTHGRLVAAACLARLHGAVAFALLGAGAAGVVLGGRVGMSPGLAGAALLHAVLIGLLGGALAPRAGCAFATVCAVLVVAAGAGASELRPAPAPHVWTPPGALAVQLLAGGSGHVRLMGWTALGALALWSLSRRASPVRQSTGADRARL